MLPRHSSVAFVVLAAGLGSRLSSVINDRPKWLVPVSNQLTVAEHQLAALELAVHPDMPHMVVTGAHSEEVDKFAAGWAERGNTAFMPHFNPHFATWNNWYSVLTGLERLGELGWTGHTMVLNGDMFCPPEWLASFAAALPGFANPITLAIDPHHPLVEEAMKVSANDGCIKRIGKVNVDNAMGEYIGLTGLTPEGAKLLMEHLREIRSAGRYNDWYEGGIQEAINAGVQVGVWETPFDEWVEIDNVDDLNKARSIAANGAA